METDLNLEPRKGDRPKTVYSVPHAQLTQQSPETIFLLLKEFVLAFPYINQEKSIGSLPSAIGAMISKDYKGKTNTVIGNEWTHIHIETGLGSMHLKLNGKDAYEAVRNKWGEYHPMNANANEKNQSAIIMLYAPRNEKELEIVKHIITASYNFVITK